MFFKIGGKKKQLIKINEIIDFTIPNLENKKSINYRVSEPRKEKKSFSIIPDNIRLQIISSTNIISNYLPQIFIFIVIEKPHNS